MTRALPARITLVIVIVLLTFVVGGCRRRTPESEGYSDPHPLPEDPLVVDAPSLGRHGGILWNIEQVYVE
jgi:hypothetical protein